ncbi:MAG: ABC transporter permease [Acidobacteriota bacterium]
MLWLENFVVAFGALRANKMRAVLTTLGIVIGVAAVIAVVSIVQGLQFLVVGQLQDVGATYLRVLPRIAFVAPGQVSRPVLLTNEDVEAIARQVPDIDAISPLVFGNETLKYKELQYRPTFVAGTDESWQEVVNQYVARGRFFSTVDVQRRRKVAVVGQTVVEELELGDDPVGKEIYIGSVPVTVIGVMEETGQTLGQDGDDMVIVPFQTSLTLFGRRAADQVQVHVRVSDTGAIEGVRDRIRRLLRQRHELGDEDADDFQIQTQDDILDLFTSILGGVTAVVAGVVSVALVVGGIGIMNIMLVSVTERTREIGLRKAVGARKQDIMMQFLIEAIALSFVGGALGVALGFGLGAAVTALVPIDLPPAHVPFWAVALAFGFSAVVGVFFGIYPAGKAAALDPIEALRYE